MENFVQGKAICFCGLKSFGEDEILKGIQLGARYIATVNHYHGWDSFLKKHQGVKFDLFIYFDQAADFRSRGDFREIDPDIDTGLQRRFPEVPVLPYADWAQLASSLNKVPTFELFTSLVRDADMVLELDFGAPFLLGTGRIQVPKQVLPPDSDPKAWGKVMQAYLLGLPDVLASLSQTRSEKLRLDSDDMHKIKVPGIPDPLWHFLPSDIDEEFFHLRWRCPIGQEHQYIDFYYGFYSENEEEGTHYGCICTASRFRGSRMRWHWIAWVDPALQGIEGIWALEKAPLTQVWKDRDEMHEELEDDGKRVPKLPPYLDEIGDSDIWPLPASRLSIYGSPAATTELDPSAILDKLVFVEGLNSATFPVVMTLFALGAREVIGEWRDEAEVVIGDWGGPRADYGGALFIKSLDYKLLAMTYLPDLLDTLKAIEANQYELRNPSDEGSGAHDYHQGQVLLDPALIPEMVVAYVQGSPFVAKWLDDAVTSADNRPRAGFSELALGEGQAFIKWVKEPDTYRIHLQRGEAEESIDDIALDDSCFGYYWSHRVMAYLNAEPGVDSVDGLIIVAGIENRNSTFQLLAVSRVWT